MWIAFLAAASCLPCHEAIVRTYAQTGMGRSVSRPTVENPVRQEGSHGSARWVALWNNKQMIHAINEEARPMQWAVGSGHEGKSYLLQLGDALFQSPLSWYARRRAWDLSPGYRSDRRLSFLRPVTPECLGCHAGAAAPIAGTVNRYAVDAIPEPGITCARCHGDGGSHAAQPTRANIVNPKRLEHSARDSVCEQCHLSGSARVTNPGKQFGDFRPGLALEDVFSVYVQAVPTSSDRIKVVSHSEQLAISRCSIASGGKLWCATCHDPHREPADAFAHHQAKCVSCHGQTRRHGDACATCHMPRTDAVDGGHTAYTDHRIRKPGVPKVLLERSTDLRAWREPAAAIRSRGLGLAYAGTGQLEKAYALLKDVARDPAVNDAMGLIYLRADRAALAVASFTLAVEADPGNSARRLNLAAAYLAVGNLAKAKAQAQEAMVLEPLLQDAYVLMAEIEPGRAEDWRDLFAKRLR